MTKKHFKPLFLSLCLFLLASARTSAANFSFDFPDFSFNQSNSTTTQDLCHQFQLGQLSSSSICLPESNTDENPTPTQQPTNFPTPTLIPTPTPTPESYSLNQRIRTRTKSSTKESTSVDTKIEQSDPEGEVSQTFDNESSQESDSHSSNSSSDSSPFSRLQDALVNLGSNLLFPLF